MPTPSPQPPQNQEWFLADCPSCQQTMRIRRDHLGTKTLLCPSCRAPIRVELSGGPPESNAGGGESSPATGDQKRLPQPGPSQPVFSSRDKIDQASAGLAGLSEEERNRRKQTAEETTFRPSVLPPPRSDRATAPPAKPAPKAGATNQIPSKRTSGQQLLVKGEGPVLESETEAAADFRRKLRGINPEHSMKIKHRRKLGDGTVRLADWDTFNLERIPEAEIAADEWAQAPAVVLPEEVIVRRTKELVTRVDVIDGREVHRVRRVQKRKVLHGVQLFFLRMTKTMRWSILGLTGFIALAGIVLLVRHFASKAQVATAPPVRPESEEQATLRANLTIQSYDDARIAVRNFLSAANWQEKLKWVRMPEETRPKMEKWYVTHPDGPLTMHEVDDFKKARLDSGYFIFLAVRVGPEHINRYFAVEEIREADGKFRFLVDWETSTAYQPMELYDFRIRQPEEPMAFRVNLKPHEYYNHGFSDSDKWRSYKLSYPGDPDFDLIGYVQRNTALEDQLQRQLLTGEHNVVVLLRYPDAKFSKVRSRDQVLIEKLDHPSWYYPRKDFPESSHRDAVGSASAP